MFEIPISGFNSETLRSLELNEISFVCDATSAVFLPRLKSLKLDHVYCESTKACEKLISGCPVLQDLYLYIYFLEESEDEEWRGIPSSVFSCESLQSLELENGYLSVPAAIVVCCTRLEILKLDRVSFESKEACEKLISGCPVLQCLYLNISTTLNGDDDDDIFTCIISSASLRHLKIYFGKKSSLKLKASSLESLEIKGVISEISVEKSLCSLVQADFRIRLVEHGVVNNSIVEAVRAFECAKVLTLSSSVMWALSRATVSMVKLVVEACCSSLQDIIQNSNNLEHLTIDQQQFDLHDHTRWDYTGRSPEMLVKQLEERSFLWL